MGYHIFTYYLLLLQLNSISEKASIVSNLGSLLRGQEFRGTRGNRERGREKRERGRDMCIWKGREEEEKEETKSVIKGELCVLTRFSVFVCLQNQKFNREYEGGLKKIQETSFVLLKLNSICLIRVFLSWSESGCVLFFIGESSWA